MLGKKAHSTILPSKGTWWEAIVETVIKKKLEPTVSEAKPGEQPDMGALPSRESNRMWALCLLDNCFCTGWSCFIYMVSLAIINIGLNGKSHRQKAVASMEDSEPTSLQSTTPTGIGQNARAHPWALGYGCSWISDANFTVISYPRLWTWFYGYDHMFHCGVKMTVSHCWGFLCLFGWWLRQRQQQQASQEQGGNRTRDSLILPCNFQMSDSVLKTKGKVELCLQAEY